MNVICIGKGNFEVICCYLFSAEIVWRFQNWFGVEKVRVTEQNRGKPFVAIECSKNENLRRSRSSESSLTDKKSSEDDDSADSNDDSKNTIHYSIGNRFWHFLFLFGSQLGDETYYAIFFSFWFWNIDGAVGRRVILVWNLVMYIGNVEKIRTSNSKNYVKSQLGKKLSSTHN